MPIEDSSSASSSASSRSNLDLTIVPATAQDVRRLVDIEFHAFESERANQQLSYRDNTNPEHFERTVNVYTKLVKHISCCDLMSRPAVRSRADSKFGTAPHESSTTSFLKVVDTESGDIISFAKMEVRQHSCEDLLQPANVGHEKEPQMNQDWFALNEQTRREYMRQVEHYYIGMLATEPCYQYNGARTLLLETMLAQADDAGLEVYLEATDTARPMYEKHGFIPITELRFNPASYGVHGLGIERQTVMVRGALNRHSQRSEVRPWAAAKA